MTLAFYYHIPIYSVNDHIYMPGYLGVFIDSLASEVDKLFIVMHEAKPHERAECEYTLTCKNLEWINLGFKTPAWYRTFSSNGAIRKKLNPIELCDAFIVRSPTPLAIKFHRYIKRPHLFFMIVGNYIEDSGHLKTSSFRNRVIYKYLHYYDKQFTYRIKHTDVLVNSPLLFEKYKAIAKSIELIRTTTLSQKDFYYRNDTCVGNEINLLFTGRIDPAKGLSELVQATSNIVRKSIPIKLNIVGWETDPIKPYEKELKILASNLGIASHVEFHGKKSIGEELNNEYRKNDIYVIPSYYEGFPRTIWEAMANSLPVIATNVGGIPKTLMDKQNVLLIEPKSIQEIELAIMEIVKNKELRMKLIHNAFHFASEITLEKQTQRMVNIVKKVLAISG